MADLYDELEFPQRAEYLDQYKNYQVDIAHWKQLAEQFQKAFRRVHARRSAAVLLVHGPQGSGKSMFCNRLEQDYERTRAGDVAPDLRNNLWHVLVTTDKHNDEPTIRGATVETTLTLVDDRKADWLSELKTVAKGDKSSRVRIFLCDDAHKDSKMRPWTDLPAKDFYEAKQAGPDALLAHVAERINEGCRGEFQRSIFVMLSNDKKWVESMRSKLDVWYKELATELTLPVPDPPTLERIVRINTNRLNRVSYWNCLDAASSERRRIVRQVLTEQVGFTDSFHAVSESLDSESRRQGRPGNRNVLTLVTLGSEFAAVQSFLEDREIETEAYHAGSAPHVGVWDVRGSWASKIVRRPDREFTRRARMLESEFVLRWVSLDMIATCALVQPPAFNDVGMQLMLLVQQRPSIGTSAETKAGWRAECAALEGRLDAAPFEATEVERLAGEFSKLGARRSIIYEKAIVGRLGTLNPAYGRGFFVYKALKPDLIVEDPDSTGHGEYKICSLTSAVSEDDKAIADAIRRTGHSIEFTAFLRERLEGLEEYLRDKIECYAAMLESV